jgi:DNA-binding NarL/FixJ family response regulator
MSKRGPQVESAERAGLRAWEQMYVQRSTADRCSPLHPHDLQEFAMAAYLTGRDREAVEILARAHSAFLAAGEEVRAARCAFWLAFILMNTGEPAGATGWLARARRLLDEGGHDAVERGYLLLPVALQHAGARDLAAAEATFGEAAQIGARFGEPDLVNLARQGRGRALIGLGQVAQGVALLDEVMVAVTSGEVSPVAAGTIYCSVISACFDMFDMRRAQEWTEALNRWCLSHPDLVPYRGECLVHRAEIMLLHGVWREASEQARRACDWLSQPSARPPVGAAFYQLGELHRLRGEFTQAEEAYRLASESGRAPYPGLALLRLAQGQLAAAKGAICRVAEETRDRRTRARVLAACVEILLAVGDVGSARHAADELSAIAGALDTTFLRALSSHARGAVQLAEGDAAAALRTLREACTLWRDLEAPYETARVTVLIALACRQLGDGDGAQMELGTAARAFRELGAAPDLAALEQLSPTGAVAVSGQLTARELQVLALVASGKTNRAIADALSISEKTVARHVSNIFGKLDLSSRSAATAYAFKHHLI